MVRIASVASAHGSELSILSRDRKEAVVKTYARHRPVFARIACLSLLTLAALAAQGRNYGRSMVISQGGIVATSQVLASQAGAQILARGGSAVDAAIAANAVLGVTEPMMTGMGGDLFAIYWDAKTGKLAGLDASVPTPKALSPEILAGKGNGSSPFYSIPTLAHPG